MSIPMKDRNLAAAITEEINYLPDSWAAEIQRVCNLGYPLAALIQQDMVTGPSPEGRTQMQDTIDSIRQMADYFLAITRGLDERDAKALFLTPPINGGRAMIAAQQYALTSAS